MDIAVIVVVVWTTVMDYGWLLGHRIIKGNKCAFYTAAISLFLFILHLEHSPWQILIYLCYLISGKLSISENNKRSRS